jgi:hypothetical protein
MSKSQPTVSARRRILLSSILAAALFGVTWPLAGSELMAQKRACTNADCQASVIPGFINGWGTSFDPPQANVAPWVGQVFAAKSECLRLRVTSQGADTEMVVIAASAIAYRSNNSNIAPCPTCPLIKFKTGGVGGWHTVQISQKGGSPVSASFTLSYGRYDNSNPNCNSPTPPVP